MRSSVDKGLVTDEAKKINLSSKGSYGANVNMEKNQCQHMSQETVFYLP